MNNRIFLKIQIKEIIFEAKLRTKIDAVGKLCNKNEKFYNLKEQMITSKNVNTLCSITHECAINVIEFQKEHFFSLKACKFVVKLIIV